MGWDRKLSEVPGWEGAGLDAFHALPVQEHVKDLNPPGQEEEPRPAPSTKSWRGKLRRAPLQPLLEGCDARSVPGTDLNGVAWVVLSSKRRGSRAPRRRSARTTLASGAVLAALLATYAAAQPENESRTLIRAKSEAAEAQRRSNALERQAAQASDEASRARAQTAALAARIEGAEADLTAAEARIRMIEALRLAQRARLAAQQGPVIRLTAALQTMARRPPALTLIQPGSLDELVHVRSLLASTLPVVRARTASLRAEIENGNRLRKEAEVAAEALGKGRQALMDRRLALADFERKQRARSASLMESALYESTRAIALGEEARDLAALEDTRQFQSELRRKLAVLPGPAPRPGTPAAAPPSGPARYRLPVDGKLVRGMGELSDGGVHARGLSFTTEAGLPVVAPAGGRVAYAGRFRSYGDIVVIDHGGGWMSAITRLGSLSVEVGQHVAIGDPIGTTGRGEQLGVELRRQGRPFPITPLIAGS